MLFRQVNIIDEDGIPMDDVWVTSNYEYVEFPTFIMTRWANVPKYTVFDLASVQKKSKKGK